MFLDGNISVYDKMHQTELLVGCMLYPTQYI